jgi:hypothetical protein
MSEVKNFKVGQVWMSRGGNEYIITSIHNDSFYPISAESRDLPRIQILTVTKNGFYDDDTDPSEYDLVKLVKDVHEETPESEAMHQTFEMKTTQRDSITVDIHFESGNEYSCIKHNENGKPYEIKLRKNGEHGGYEITFDSLEEMKVIANAMLKMCDQS